MERSDCDYIITYILYNAMNGAPGRTRTCDQQVRNLLLYPTELREQMSTSIEARNRSLGND